MIRLILLSVFALSSPVALACSFAQPMPVEFDASLAKPGEAPPPAPAVTIESISRGGTGTPLDSCSDTGVVVLSVPASRKNKDLAYAFQVVSGSADDVIFQPGPSTGFRDTGKFIFVFPWVDGTNSKQEPLNLVVRVTAFRRSGLAGGATDVKVVDPGR